jgi:hypothetical protein
MTDEEKKREFFDKAMEMLPEENRDAAAMTFMALIDLATKGKGPSRPRDTGIIAAVDKAMTECDACDKKGKGLCDRCTLPLNLLLDVTLAWRT